jgi:DNA-directed RNA polymerase specialized sigma subunit
MDKKFVKDEVIDELNQVIYIDKSIKSKLDKIAYYRSLAGLNEQSSLNEQISLWESAAKIIELENDVNEEIDRLVALKAEIESIIKKVERPKLRQLLELRYICGKTWKQVAEDMHYDVSHVYRLHGCALNALAKVKKIAKIAKDESK